MCTVPFSKQQKATQMFCTVLNSKMEKTKWHKYNLYHSDALSQQTKKAVEFLSLRLSLCLSLFLSFHSKPFFVCCVFFCCENASELYRLFVCYSVHSFKFFLKHQKRKWACVHSHVNSEEMVVTSLIFAVFVNSRAPTIIPHSTECVLFFKADNFWDLNAFQFRGSKCSQLT